MPIGEDVDFEELAALTENYVGSDIEAICREAAMLALRENFEAKKVEMKHFRDALKKVKPTMNDMVTAITRTSRTISRAARRRKSRRPSRQTSTCKTRTPFYFFMLFCDF